MTCPFTLHKYPFDIEHLNSNFLVLSIDPGENNLGISIFEDTDIFNFYKDHASELKDSMLPNIVEHQNHKFQNNKHHFRNICLYLKTIDLSEVKLVLIEKQLVRSLKISNISKNIISFCLTHLNAIVIEINSQQKSSQFDCPKGVKGPKLKEWEVVTAYNMLGHERCLPWFSKRISQEEIDALLSLEGPDLEEKIRKYQRRKNQKLDEGSSTIMQYLAFKKWLQQEGSRKKLVKDIDILLY